MNVSQFSCMICNKQYSNQSMLTFHKRSSQHRNKKEVQNLMAQISEFEKKNSILEKENIELRNLVNESTDAIFMYEMRINGSNKNIPK